MRTVVVAILAGVLVLCSACAIPTGRTPSRPAPVTVTHAFGTTTLTDVPKNIVALGEQWVDGMFALGVTPVARLGGLPDAPPPWVPPDYAGMRQLDASGDLVAQIAAVRPDLILLDRLPADRATYDRLAAVAPTVPLDPRAGWREQVTVLGTLLRASDRAARFIADHEARLTDLTRAAPGLAGRTYAVTWLASESQLFALTGPGPAAAEMFTRLGLRVPYDLAELPAVDGHIVLAPEEIDRIDADLLVAGYSPGLDETYRRLPGYAELPAAVRNSVVFLTAEEVAAVERPTALSAVYLLAKLRQALAAAAR
ncbi:ABC transporter substrate-binding protein [Nocardia arizonensis]|uniref:ABC transporter substrate-binding protein n=1 Tax=Nocardia arizonensis TaxID=1141647 RepID=UPI0006CF92D0|nr:ABC transporter substrate-binding protein [Nocardia arizonensis]